MDTIVVGVDGSPESAAALRFALRESRAHGAVLRAVVAWEVPTMVYAGGMAPPLPDLGEELEREAAKSLDAALDALGADAADVSIERAVRRGQAAEVLTEESETADLLVVGSRGHGGFAGLLLGSVSQQCAHHARCPITIVRAVVSA